MFEVEKGMVEVVMKNNQWKITDYRWQSMCITFQIQKSANQKGVVQFSVCLSSAADCSAEFIITLSAEISPKCCWVQWEGSDI